MLLLFKGDLSFALRQSAINSRHQLAKPCYVCTSTSSTLEEVEESHLNFEHLSNSQ